MSDKRHRGTNPVQPMVYQIRIKGHLAPHWAESFAGMRITQVANGETLVSGTVLDQAALHGLLKKVRDLGLPLLSVIRVEPGKTDTAHAE